MTVTSEKTAEDLQASSERPTAPLRTDAFRASRPEIVGPTTVEYPFPIFLAGAVQRGFGRGGKDLGCPTGEVV
jgi:riboflavin kinase